MNELLKNSIVNDSILNEITKNYKNEIFLYRTTDSLSSTFENKLCLLMNKEEIKTLIENYRELVVKDYTQENISNEIIKDFRNKSKNFVKNQNATTKVKYKNTTDKAQTLTLVVGGKGMPAASNGNAGMQGVDGFARVLVVS